VFIGTLFSTLSLSLSFCYPRPYHWVTGEKKYNFPGTFDHAPGLGKKRFSRRSLGSWRPRGLFGGVARFATHDHKTHRPGLHIRFATQPGRPSAGSPAECAADAARRFRRTKANRTLKKETFTLVPSAARKPEKIIVNGF